MQNEVRPSLLEAGLSQFPDHLAAETATVTTEVCWRTTLLYAYPFLTMRRKS